MMFVAFAFVQFKSQQATLDERGIWIDDMDVFRDGIISEAERLAADRFYRSEAERLHEQQRIGWDQLRIKYPELPSWPEFPHRKDYKEE